MRTAVATVPQTYAALRHAVELTMIRGQREIDQAKVRTYWETGRLIKEHVLLFKERADYGSRTIQRLGADLKIDRSVLNRCVRFVECFPIGATWPQLTWGHYRVLIPVADAKFRLGLAAKAARNEWPIVRLEQHLRTLAPPVVTDTASVPATGKAETQLAPKRGTAGVCKVVAAGGIPTRNGDGGLVVDLGFACYLDLPEGAEFAAGAFVQQDSAGRMTVAAGAGKTDLFNYSAAVLKVVDGDTLWVKIYLRPRQWVKQKLRLRDLDCPELDTADGKAAKRFTESLVARATAVTICTTKPDKYDRYLADVFLEQDGEPVFLNNALLAAGHATVKEEWEFSDWGV